MSERVKRRAEFYKQFGMLKVFLISREDIMLFKGITERAGDFEDMEAIAKEGVDWDIVRDEVFAQGGERSWEGLLYNRLHELRERYKINVPILRDLLKRDRENIVKEYLHKLLSSGKNSQKEIIADFREKGFSESWTKKQLREFAKKRILKKTGRGENAKFQL